MLKSKWWYVVFIVFIFMIAGCASESESESAGDATQPESAEETVEGGNLEEGNSPETEEVAKVTEDDFFADLPEPPTTLEELLTYPSGEFSGKEFAEQSDDIEKILDQFPESGEEISQEETSRYWQKLLTLFAEEFPDPENVVDQWGGSTLNGPEVAGEEVPFKENYNVEIILDSSGSMANYQGDQTRMELAKEAITEFAESLPEEANVGLRAYGFEGSNAEADKEVSCASNELVYEIAPYDEEGLAEAMEQFSPTGWTPLAEAISMAESDLAEYDGENNTNIIYVVSDGVETCDGDPVEDAETLAASNITPVANVIGFDVDNEGQQQLEDVAEAAEGTYTDVENQDQLQDEFQRASELAGEWRLWKANAMGDARMENVDRAQSMRDFRSEWSDSHKMERHNFNEAIKYLQREREAISRDTSMKLHDMRNERLDMLSDLRSDAWDNLSEIKDKEFEEAKDEIQDKYDANAPD
ncbi:VWA domain-containing protein [Virgibacillus sp. NKC19-16]|uniref:vWA domain-containing protein n=1 Tax=Virgibacillus salidurans TaxID=2831673 RepID=UPI001F45F2E3|nr:VWA domain-containing protein [Virgibacillus sp. NKC19-16]UJL46367.1 VWA domain-containing protein [Virgibacillus sp. NKC19-16]